MRLNPHTTTSDQTTNASIFRYNLEHLSSPISAQFFIRIHDRDRHLRNEFEDRANWIIALGEDGYRRYRIRVEDMTASAIVTVEG